MLSRSWIYLFAGLFSVFITTFCSAQSLLSDKAVRTQVFAAKASHSDIERASAAEDLFDMVKGKNLDHVHTATIRLISSVIDANDDAVTVWIAATLGEFRGRASFAAPTLIRHLKKVDCLRVDASSAFTIRTALKKMGEKVPASECPSL